MKRITQISRDIPLEVLVDNYPFAGHYLSQQGIRCIACGEPVWLTLEEAAKEMGFDDQDIAEFVNELNLMAMNEMNNKKNGKPVRITSISITHLKPPG